MARDMHRFPERVFDDDDKTKVRMNESEARARACEMLAEAIDATPPGIIRRARVIYLYLCDDTNRYLRSVMGGMWSYTDELLFPAPVRETFARDDIYIAGIHIQLDVPEDEEWPKLVQKLPIARAQ